MATIKSITVEYGYTFNLGNYSSVRPAVSLTAELQPGEEPDEAIFALQRDAREAVENEIDALLMQTGKAPYFRQLRDDATKKPLPEEETPF